MIVEGVSLVLRCETIQDAHAVRVAFWLTNQSGQELGVFNRIVVPRLDGTRAFPPGAVYIDLQESNLVLQKKVLSVPPGLRMAARIMPQASRLRNGEVLHEVFDLPLPVQVCQPMRRALLSGKSPAAEVVANLPAEAAEVVLELGVIPCGGGLELVPVSPAHPGVFDAVPPHLAIERQFIVQQTASFATKLPVLDYMAIPLKAAS